MPHIVVTGAAGFIGSHLCDRLLALGHSVTGLDNLLTGNAANLAAARDHDGFDFQIADITTDPIPEADIHVNLACPASPPRYQIDRIATFRTSVIGAEAVARTALASGGRVLQASTSEVYGIALTHPQTEDDPGRVDPTGPRACYGEGKRAAETLLTDYRRAHGLDLRIARIFNTYGPRMDPGDGRVIPAFLDAALRGQPLRIYGDGTQTRSFCYVDDLVTALAAMTLDDAPIDTPLNLGNPAEITMLELAQIIREVTGTPCTLDFAPAQADDPPRRCPDITRARTRLNWEPKITLCEGLERTLASLGTDLEPTAALRRSTVP